MKKLVLIGAVFLTAAVFGPPSAASGVSGGVSAGSPVTVRANPDNAVVAATRAAAANVGLGPVTAIGFQPDCSPIEGQVVVCRNPSLHTTGARAVTLPGPNSCVVRADPSVGGAPHGVNVLTKAPRKCISG